MPVISTTHLDFSCPNPLNSASMAEYDIYSSQLHSLGHGLALYEPDPAGKYDEVRVGDVGHVVYGKFHRFFNIFDDPEEGEEGLLLPEGFEPLDARLAETYQRTPLAPGLMCSTSVRRVGGGIGAVAGAILEAGSTVHLSCSHRLGAALITRHRSFREDSQKTRAFVKYMVRHHRAWVRFARERLFVEVGGGGGGIVLVTGCDLTAEWTMATFVDREVEARVSFVAGAGGVGGGVGGGLGVGGPMVGAEVWGSWTMNVTVPHRYGPVDVIRPGSRRSSTSSSTHPSITTTTTTTDSPQTPTSPNTERESSSPSLPSSSPTTEPSQSQQEREPKFDQCVFLRGYRLKERMRPFPPKVIRAGAEPEELRGSPPPEEGVEVLVEGVGEDEDGVEIEVEHDPPINGDAVDNDVYDMLANHIFENTDAEFALTHDEEVASVYLQGDIETLDDFRTALQTFNSSDNFEIEEIEGVKVGRWVAPKVDIQRLSIEVSVPDESQPPTPAPPKFGEVEVAKGCNGDNDSVAAVAAAGKGGNLDCWCWCLLSGLHHGEIRGDETAELVLRNNGYGYEAGEVKGGGVVEKAQTETVQVQAQVQVVSADADADADESSERDGEGVIVEIADGVKDATTRVLKCGGSAEASSRAQGLEREGDEREGSAIVKEDLNNNSNNIHKDKDGEDDDGPTTRISLVAETTAGTFPEDVPGEANNDVNVTPLLLSEPTSSERVHGSQSAEGVDVVDENRTGLGKEASLASVDEGDGGGGGGDESGLGILRVIKEVGFGGDEKTRSEKCAPPSLDGIVVVQGIDNPEVAFAIPELKEDSLLRNAHVDVDVLCHICSASHSQTEWTDLEYMDGNSPDDGSVSEGDDGYSTAVEFDSDVYEQDRVETPRFGDRSEASSISSRTDGHEGTHTSPKHASRMFKTDTKTPQPAGSPSVKAENVPRNLWLPKYSGEVSNSNSDPLFREYNDTRTTSPSYSTSTRTQLKPRTGDEETSEAETETQSRTGVKASLAVVPHAAPECNKFNIETDGERALFPLEGSDELKDLIKSAVQTFESNTKTRAISQSGGELKSPTTTHQTTLSSLAPKKSSTKPDRPQSFYKLRRVAPSIKSSRSEPEDPDTGLSRIDKLRRASALSKKKVENTAPNPSSSSHSNITSTPKLSKHSMALVDPAELGRNDAAPNLEMQMQLQILEEDIKNGKDLIATMSMNLDPDVGPLLTSLRVKIREKEIMYRRLKGLFG